DEESGTETGTGSGTASQTGTATGCEDPTDSECIALCEGLYTCIQAEPGQCPGLQGYPEEDYLCGSTDAGGCFVQCDANPALKAVYDADDCATTIGTLLGLNATFAESCSDGSGGGGTGGSSSGGSSAGGSSSGGSSASCGAGGG
ncbi:MAG: hypothetical protein JRI23_12100, partial [Deltaproteobacteria bacterium]|nr:hypothetical protein [Deltaproteobacteria bacterium]MBW2532451.1 hypothetical protein [Deltaproteobacteria bacterium]